MTDLKANYDSPWKQVLEDYFPEFMLFFFPAIHADIDWEQGYEFLDTELQQVLREAEVGKRLADKLVKVRKISGEELWVLIHCEIQAQAETDFAERMFTYNYRLRDRYNQPVVSLAVLVDDQPTWRPTKFRSKMWGCWTVFRFPMVKLLDYREKWSTLEESLNPFATVVMVHLKALETKGQPLQRKEWKLTLSRRLYEKGYQRQDVINLFRFIDWLMTLPDELEGQFEQELERYEREMQMPYITSIERKAEQRGLEQGIEQGLERGIERGTQRGLLLGLIEGIETGLELKFGSEGLQLLPDITKINNVEALRKIRVSLKQVNSITELQKILNRESQ